MSDKTEGALKIITYSEWKTSIKWIIPEYSHLQNEFGDILENISWGPLEDVSIMWPHIDLV